MLAFLLHRKLIAKVREARSATTVGTNEVNLDLRVDTTDLYPGEAVTGSLTVSVSGAVECTAVRVEIIGVASVQLATRDLGRDHRRRRSSADCAQTVEYVKHSITCYGFPPSSGRAGGCFLLPGSLYSYNFGYQIPMNVLGTIGCEQGAAEVGLAWSVRAYVDVPAKPKKAVAVDLFVRTPAAASQVWNTPRPLPSVDQGAGLGAQTSYFCRETKQNVSVEVVLSPAVGIVDCASYTNGQPTGELRFTVRVLNATSKVDLKDARVTLSQCLTATAQNCTAKTAMKLAEVTLRRYTQFVTPANQEGALYSGTLTLTDAPVCPSVACGLFNITHRIDVEFPRSKLKDGVFAYAMVFANGEDAFNNVSPLPRFYVGNVQHTEVQL